MEKEIVIAPFGRHFVLICDLGNHCHKIKKQDSFYMAQISRKDIQIPFEEWKYSSTRYMLPAVYVNNAMTVSKNFR